MQKDKEQSAAKAASKKAKKLRQKAKGQEAQPAAADSSQPGLPAQTEAEQDAAAAVMLDAHAHDDASQLPLLDSQTHSMQAAMAATEDQQSSAPNCSNSDQELIKQTCTVKGPSSNARPTAIDAAASFKAMHICEDINAEHALAHDKQQSLDMPHVQRQHANASSLHQRHSQEAQFLKKLTSCPITKVSGRMFKGM